MAALIRRTKAVEARTTITAVAVVTTPGALTPGIVGIDFTLGSATEISLSPVPLRGTELTN